ncbi:hypothetical protein QBC47DRAFT_375942 [Echria macrotheca]|uniref:J domain-containing protein n=1 Tax=Echria macrotheca TaxID=438768 RepID=A0AAJ0BFN7_9PEZI|nr:hypothetical protein QBC47DRAFT_375942 [Echria macrotheca]
MSDARSRRIPSGAYEDTASVRGGYAHSSAHRLRPADSRFSLRDQFATTRREYDFGFEDAQSILDSSTVASEAVWALDHDDPRLSGHETPPVSAVYRDYYELLCLPRDPSLSPEEIRKAFHRLVQVLSVEKQPARLQSAAAFNLGLAQAAFETLVEPCRRIGYDLSVSNQEDSDGAEITTESDLIGPNGQDAYERALREQYLLLAQGGIRSSTDLGLRLEAGPSLIPRRGRPQRAGLRMLDFSLRQSATAKVPVLQAPIEKAGLFLLDVGDRTRPTRLKHVRFAEPTVTVTGAAHGLLDEPFRVAPVLLDRYQPPGPSVHGRRRLEQLLASRFLPVLNLTLRQEVSWRDPQHQSSYSPYRPLPDTVVEQEIEFLPHPSTTLRVGHSIDLAGSRDPLNVEVSLHKGFRHALTPSPSLGLALHQKTASGTAFLVADAGDWRLWPSKECRDLSQFSKLNGRIGQAQAALDPFRHAPTLEAGYAFGTAAQMGVLSERPFTKPAERGVRGMDADWDGRDGDATGPWTISAGVSSGIAATYLRYGRDLVFSSLFAGKAKSQRRSAGGIRAEMELANSTQRDFVLAFRALTRVGRFSRAGLELGLTPGNIHLSLYWSRLGQRISLPFMVVRKASLSTRFLFWATVVPFAAFAAVELVYRQLRLRLAKSAAANTEKSPPSGVGKKDDLQRYVARRRAEADELTVILATGVEPRQNRERQGGGLVILSAKYGVKDAPPDEIADVTIAVAALVDNGKLVIPKGMRKSRLLGFWDPAPMSTKVLSVRYVYQGREQMVEVSGRDELMLP